MLCNHPEISMSRARWIVCLGLLSVAMAGCMGAEQKAPVANAAPETSIVPSSSAFAITGGGAKAARPPATPPAAGLPVQIVTRWSIGPTAPAGHRFEDLRQAAQGPDQAFAMELDRLTEEAKPHGAREQHKVQTALLGALKSSNRDHYVTAVNWLRFRLLTGEGLQSWHALYYSYLLWGSGREDLREVAFAGFVTTYLLLAVEGSRCENTAGGQENLQKLLLSDFEILKQIAKLSDDRKERAIETALHWEASSFGRRDPDISICWTDRDGLLAMNEILKRREIANPNAKIENGHHEDGLVVSSKNNVHNIYVLPGPDFKPALRKPAEFVQSRAKLREAFRPKFLELLAKVS